MQTPCNQNDDLSLTTILVTAILPCLARGVTLGTREHQSIIKTHKASDGSVMVRGGRGWCRFTPASVVLGVRFCLRDRRDTAVDSYVNVLLSGIVDRTMNFMTKLFFRRYNSSGFHRLPCTDITKIWVTRVHTYSHNSRQTKVGRPSYPFLYFYLLLSASATPAW